MTVYDRISGAVPFEQRGECPVLRRLSEMLVAIMMEQTGESGSPESGGFKGVTCKRGKD